jgi:hypothetical protein
MSTYVNSMDRNISVQKELKINKAQSHSYIIGLLSMLYMRLITLSISKVPACCNINIRALL